VIGVERVVEHCHGKGASFAHGTAFPNPSGCLGRDSAPLHYAAKRLYL
jgi:hypothetical protein